MQLWCVPSHHDLHGEPWKRKGVQILDEDLWPTDVGVWVLDSANSLSESSPTRIHIDRTFQISPMSAQYLAVLRALVAIDRPDLIAVVSLRWAVSELYRPGFLVPKRVWLSIYRVGHNPEHEVWGLHHMADSKHTPVRSFLEIYHERDAASVEDMIAFFNTELNKALIPA